MIAQKVNTKWFRERLAERDMSIRRLGKLMELDPSAVSLMLRGKRVMTAAEANQISGLLTIPVTEVLAQAGVPIEEDSRQLQVKAYVDARGVVHANKVKNARRVSVPRDVPANGVVVQVRAPEILTDGWLIIASGFDSRVEALLDRLCVVDIAGGGQTIGTLRRGYDQDCYSVVPFVGNASVDNVSVKAVAAVLWIRPV
jgi:transcriptional regulator with XRE-family HTH domain